MLKTIETEVFLIEKLDHQVYRATLKDKVELTLEHAVRFHEAMLEITDAGKHVLVFDGTDLVYAHSDAREFLADVQRDLKTAIAVSVVAKSSLATIAGNIFLTINRPSFPMKLFTNSIEAERWALSHLKDYQIAA